MKFFKFYIVLLLIISADVLGQKPKVKNDPTHDDKPLHFGFSLGLNYMNFAVYQSEWAQQNNVYVGIASLKPGINIQAITNLRLAENWDLRSLPGISFGERHLDYIKVGALDDAGNRYDSIMYDGQPYRMESSFLVLPVSFKYKAKRMNNFRPYLIAGGNVRYDLAVKRNYDWKEQLIMTKPLDFYVEFGSGLDFYLTYFKFAVELKYSIGLSNVFRTTDRAGDAPVENQEYTNAISKLKTHIFTISFHFE